jgi:predicted TIM-barrel fold metal-dependent hydrolase
MGIFGSAALAESSQAYGGLRLESHSDADHFRELYQRVSQTPLIDTHEHLIEESERLSGVPNRFVRVDDWTMLFSHYLDSDMVVAGMSTTEYNRFFSPQVDPHDKWRILEPYWPLVKNTGYARAVRISLAMLYDVDELSATTVDKLQEGYIRFRQPGFYDELLRKKANIESCQVNSLGGPFGETEYPELLMQDLSIVGMFAGPDFERFGKPSGIDVKDLSDWHRVIDWWFNKYARYAVAIKSQHAYSRDIDYGRVPADQVENVFRMVLQQDPVAANQRRLLEDHLFWYAVDKATVNNLPVKLHTGYYAGHNRMPLGRLALNPASASQLCQAAPDTKFVFMHIGYPYYEEMLALAKHFGNAYIDMCWAWIINPLASKEFVKKLVVTAPVNKLLPFGGDYIPVEPILGHAEIARMGIAQALAELVQERWLSMSDALDLIDPILHENARNLFHLAEKSRTLQNAFWKQPLQ